MSSAAPGRLREFFSSRTGIAVAAVGALVLAGAVAVALRGEPESDLGIVLDPTTTTTVTTAPPPSTDGVLLGASISSEVRSPEAEKAAVEDLERVMGRLRHGCGIVFLSDPRGVEDRRSVGQEAVGTCLRFLRRSNCTVSPPMPSFEGRSVRVGSCTVSHPGGDAANARTGSGLLGCASSTRTADGA